MIQQHPTRKDSRRTLLTRLALATGICLSLIGSGCSEGQENRPTKEEVAAVQKSFRDLTTKVETLTETVNELDTAVKDNQNQPQTLPDEDDTYRQPITSYKVNVDDRLYGRLDGLFNYLHLKSLIRDSSADRFYIAKQIAGRDNRISQEELTNFVTNEGHTTEEGDLFEHTNATGVTIWTGTPRIKYDSREVRDMLYNSISAHATSAGVDNTSAWKAHIIDWILEEQALTRQDDFYFRISAENVNAYDNALNQGKYPGVPGQCD